MTFYKSNIIVLLAFLVCPSGLLAAEGIYTVEAWTHKKLTQAHEAIGAEDFKVAVALMEKTLQARRLNAHERALVHQTLGYAFTGLDRMQDAAKSFEESLSDAALPKGQLANVEFNLAQIYLADRNFERGIKLLRKWHDEADNPSGEASFLLASAYVQTKAFSKAKFFALQATRNAGAKESWLRLAFLVHWELREFEQGSVVLKRLIELSSKPLYWQQLIAVLVELQRFDEALAAFELADRLYGTADENMLLRYTSLCMRQGLPYKGASRLEQALRDGAVEEKASTLR